MIIPKQKEINLEDPSLKKKGLKKKDIHQKKNITKPYKDENENENENQENTK